MKQSRELKRHREPEAHRKVQQAGRGGRRIRPRRKRVFVGVWVPGVLADALGSSVQKLGFKDRSAFLRSVLQSAVEAAGEKM
jgi:hypothetical protein